MSYTEKITKNSFWGTASFIFTSAIGFIISVEITRYFGKELYGQYSYFIWLTTVISFFAGFGLNQGLTKYLSRFFFEKNGPEKTNNLIKYFLSFQIITGTIISLVLFAIVSFFTHLTPFQEDLKTKFLLIAIFCVIPLALNSFLTTALSALQQFKKLSIIQIIFSLLNLAFTTFFVLSKQSIENFLHLFLGIAAITCLSYLFTLASFLGEGKKNESKEKISSPAISWKEIIIYCAWNYLGIIFSQIAWERSEFFFLGIYSNSDQIAIYSLSYSLAVLFIGIFGPITTVLSNITAEVIGTDKKDQIANICQHASKYLAMIMLPAVLYSSLFLINIIEFVYGKDFKEAGLFFPFLVLSHTIAIIVTPASNVAYFKNEVRRMTLITVVTGVVNIILDFLLIPRFQLIGAVAANTLAQIFSIALVLFNARKYQLRLFNKYTLRVFFINIILAITFFVALYFNISVTLKLMIALVSMIIYVFFLIKFAFNHNDLSILENLLKILPKKFQPGGKFVLEKIRKNI